MRLIVLALFAFALISLALTVRDLVRDLRGKND